MNDRNDVIDWFKYERMPYQQQGELMKADLETDRGSFRYKQRIVGVFGDSTGGAGDAPMEILAEKSGLPVSEDSRYVFTLTGAGAGGGPNVRVFSGKDLTLLAGPGTRAAASLPTSGGF